VYWARPNRVYPVEYIRAIPRHLATSAPAFVDAMARAGLPPQGQRAVLEALFEAQESTADEMEALTRKLETEQKLTPQQAHDQAWEMIREKYILLPPEESLSL
jgi:TRAP-type C4-dicarboxylate transport system substrate-binding protein